MSSSESGSDYEPRISEGSSDDDQVRDLVPPTPVKVPQKSKAQRKREFEEFERHQSIKRQNWEKYLKRLRPNGIPPWEANNDVF